jgi:hypothetical protein
MTRGKTTPPPTNSDQDSPKPEPKHWLEFAIFAFVVGTTIATAIAAYYTSWQWDAANRQANTANDTEKRSLRAYVAVPPGDVKDFGTPKQSIILERRNSGQTPAYGVGILTATADIILVGQPIPNPTGCAHPNLRDLMTVFPNVPVPLLINFEPAAYRKLFSQDKIDTVSANVRIMREPTLYS